MKHLTLAICLAVFATAASLAQEPPPPYGAAIRLETAKRVLAAAQAEARSNRWNVVITVVDTGGHVVVTERMDDTQVGSIDVAYRKARSAVFFRRPTKAFQDSLAAGGDGLRVLKVEDAMPIEGGLPILVEGRIVGGIGVSGVTPQQDGQIAQAGVRALARR